MNTWFVVGNKFGEFAANNGVVTVGELEGLLRSQERGRLPADVKLVPGQGLREADMQRIRHEALQARDAAGVIDIELGPVRASRLLTHKYHLQNSIVSVPQQVGADVFESALLLDERSELMSDHQTGQHIQGMVLVEAARQMFLAVTEEYFIGYDDATRYYFVINSMDVTFQAFVFPVEATLRYEILEKKIDNRARMFFRVVIAVNQAGRCATRIAYEFTAFHAQRIETKEREQAVAVLSSVREARRHAAGHETGVSA
jgi:hypothetical protein